MCIGAGFVDQKGFGSAADSGSPHFGVDHDFACHCDIGRRMYVDMADTFQMGEYRNTRLLLHPSDQPLAATRNNDVDCSPKPGKHGTNGPPVGRGRDLDGVDRKSGHIEPFGQAGVNPAR